MNSSPFNVLSAEDKRYLSVDEYCWTYSDHHTSAYGAIKAGKLRSVKRGRRRLIRRDWAEEYHQNLLGAGESK